MSSLSNEALASVEDVNVTTTSQIKNLIGPIRKNKRAARAARSYMDKSVLPSAKQQREISTFVTLIATWAYNTKCFITIQTI